MFSIAYLFFLWLGYIQVPFDIGIFCFLILADIMLQGLGRWVYKKRKILTKVANALKNAV